MFNILGSTLTDALVWSVIGVSIIVFIILIGINIYVRKLRKQIDEEEIAKGTSSNVVGEEDANISTLEKKIIDVASKEIVEEEDDYLGTYSKEEITEEDITLEDNEDNVIYIFETKNDKISIKKVQLK